MKEIESKAWVLESDKKKVLDFLQNSTNINALQNGEKIVKKDIMYTQLESANTSKKKTAFRLREESGKYWVTKKSRNYTDSGTEVNSEIEFEVSNGTEFDTFVKKLGYTEMYTKEKNIYQYEYVNKNSEKFLIEYVSIPELADKGDLLEIEILCTDDASESEIIEAENNILYIFKKLQLENQIESAPYGKLLRQF